MVTFEKTVCKISLKLSSIININRALSDIWCKRSRDLSKNDVITSFPCVKQRVIIARSYNIVIDEFELVLAHECTLNRTPPRIIVMLKKLRRNEDDTEFFFAGCM